MKMMFKHSELLNALNLVARACSGQNTLPILSCVYIQSEAGEVTFTGTDLNIGIDVKVPAVIHKDGAVAVPIKPLLSLVKELPKTEQVTFELEVGRLSVLSGTGTFKINGMDVDDYPEMSEIAGETFTIVCSELHEMLRQTEFAAAKDEMRYTLNSIYFNEHELVAANSNILAKVATPHQMPRFLLPLHAATEFLKIFNRLDEDITINVEGDKVSFRTDTVRLTSRTIEMEYPTYWKIIPEKYWRVSHEEGTGIKHEHCITVNRSEFLQSCRRVSVFANKHALVKMDINGEQIRLSCEDEESGSSEVNVPCSGSVEIQLGFNAYGLQQIISHITGELLVMEFKDDLSATLFKSEDNDDFVTVIMPLRLGNPQDDNDDYEE